MVDKIVTDYV
jgi:hypothetical protein